MGRTLIASCLLTLTTALAVGAPPQKPISNPKFDPNAPQLGMFEAIDAGAVDVKMIPKNALGGNLLITNKGQEPITVKIPDGFVGVPVAAQFGGGGGGFGQGGAGGGQGGQGGQQGGGQQSVGGGQGGQQGGGGQFGGGGGGGQGFFSIPAERSVIVPYTSVCLEHGKAEPTPRAQYQVVPVEQYTADPVLQQVIKMVGTGRLEAGAAQAATWNLSSKMSWDQLANKKFNHLAQPDSPYFSRAQLMQAQNIVATAAQLAQTAEEVPTAPETVTPRTQRTAR